MQTTNDTDPFLPPKPPMFPEELEHAGITLKSHWPTPKIILDEPGAKYILSYVKNYDPHAAHTFMDLAFTDVYIYQKDGRQSLVFADKITTKHDTYGSCDIMVFLDTINNGRADHPWRTIMFGMLSLGLFQFKSTPERETDGIF